MSGAAFHRGESEQSVSTPAEFIRAVEARFGPIGFDLAASDGNCKSSKARFGPIGFDLAVSANNRKSPNFFDVAADSLAQDWSAINASVMWLNPPYSDIVPWAAKCSERRNDSRWTLLLCPASVGSRWFQRHVAPNAMVLNLLGRLTFDGHTKPYPKDLILCCFGYGVVCNQSWDWRNQCR